MKKLTIILLSIAIIGALFSVYAWFAKRETNRCFSFQFACQLAEATAERDGMLPEGFDAFAAWHNRKEPDALWPANGLASLYDVRWAISVTNLTEESELDPPMIISCKPAYLKKTEKAINREFVGTSSQCTWTGQPSMRKGIRFESQPILSDDFQ